MELNTKVGQALSGKYRLTVYSEVTVAYTVACGMTYWDLNPYLAVLETAVLPIKLRPHIYKRNKI